MLLWCADSFHDDVRNQAARALPACVSAAHAAQPPPDGRPLSEAAQTVCTGAAEALLLTAGTDPERQVVASCFAALTELCEAVPEGAIAPELGAQAAAIIVGVRCCAPACMSARLLPVPAQLCSVFSLLVH